jgi:acyl-coenzyme A thioesterase 9
VSSFLPPPVSDADLSPDIQHVGVRANVVDVKTGSERTTNDFRLTWCLDTEPEGFKTRQVVPRTYRGAFLLFF